MYINIYIYHIYIIYIIYIYICYYMFVDTKVITLITLEFTRFVFFNS